jgi:hypothetical protein
MRSVCYYLFNRGDEFGSEAGKRAYDAACKQRGTDDDYGQKPGADVNIACLT